MSNLILPPWLQPSLSLNKVHHGDCLELMPLIPSGSVDMILCDLPYGTTACSWDTIIPFDALWEQYKRIIKSNGAIVLTSNQPFTTALIGSNLAMFKYCWVWQKPPVSFVHAKRQPMREHEDVCVFSFAGVTHGSSTPLVYNPQGLTRIDAVKRNGKKAERETLNIGENNSLRNETYVQEFTGYPKTIIKFGRDNEKYHPTQKPVALFEYLIRTYTNPGEVVLDNCMGSGTTAIAAIRSGRRFIGIEQEAKYIEICNKRINDEISEWLRPAPSIPAWLK